MVRDVFAPVDAALARWKANVQTEKKESSTAHDYKAGQAAWQTNDVLTTEPGNRYIDFLLPGLMGMNLMGGGLWGVGFVIVDMRVRKLLKREPAPLPGFSSILKE